MTERDLMSSHQDEIELRRLLAAVWQLRWMVVAGTCLVPLVVLLVIVSRPLADHGFVFVLPYILLIIFFVMAGIAGVVAAVPPAYRAAKVDVLRAVTTE